MTLAATKELHWVGYRSLAVTPDPNKLLQDMPHSTRTICFDRLNLSRFKVKHLADQWKGLDPGIFA